MNITILTTANVSIGHIMMIALEILQLNSRKQRNARRKPAMSIFVLLLHAFSASVLLLESKTERIHDYHA